MHTNESQGHDVGKPEEVAAGSLVSSAKKEEPHDAHLLEAEVAGYEVRDVNVGGVTTFLAGLGGCILVFFVFCFFMGKAINYLLAKQDGPQDRWHQQVQAMGEAEHGADLEHMKSNAAVEQEQLATMARTFPAPRLETDDGNQDTADLHAREDLLLEHYSSSTDLPQGAVRIPIERAMQLVVQRGLPKYDGAGSSRKLMAGEDAHAVQVPLTDGFARTGYELGTIKARQERLEFDHAEK